MNSQVVASRRQLRLRGHAVGWRHPLADSIGAWAASGELGFSEIVAENHHPDRLDPRLVELASRVPVIPHGVTLGLGGADEPDPDRLERLAGLALRLGSPMVSEHVAFVRAADTPDALHPEVLEAGHLMPPARTEETLEILVANVRIAQSRLPVPLALENIAALFTWPEDTMDEAEFLTRLVEETGIGLVLDVANLFSSALARGSDAAADVRRFPLEAVAYVHIAGGEFRSGLYLDSHGHDLVEPVVDLLGELEGLYEPSQRPGVMLERDSDISVAGVRREFERLVSR